MNEILYSASLESYNGDISPAIREGIEEIKQFFSLPEARILQFDEHHIAIPVLFTVPLPPLGPVDGIDIREVEPAFIKISLLRYPDIIPLVLSDRQNFPKKFLPHLYVSQKENDPAKFCNVRNNPHEWFASKRLSDLLAVAEQWLFKAAIGKLIEDGDEFDPTRLERYNGYHIYQYDLLHGVVHNDERFLSEHPFALLFSTVNQDDTHSQRQGLTYKTLAAIPFIQMQATLEAFRKTNHTETQNVTASPLVSLLVWRDDKEPEREYCTALPTSYGTLKLYFAARGIELQELVCT